MFRGVHFAEEPLVVLAAGHNFRMGRTAASAEFAACAIVRVGGRVDDKARFVLLVSRRGVSRRGRQSGCGREQQQHQQ